MKKSQSKFISSTVLLIITFGISTALAGTIELAAGKNRIEIKENTYHKLRISSTISQIGTLEVNTPEGIFTMLSVEGFGLRNIEGEPALPVYKKLIEVPLNADFRIRVINQHYYDIDLSSHGVNHALFPAQLPMSKSDDPSQVKFVYNREYYSNNRFTNDQPSTVTHVGILRMMNLARIELNPVSYNPVENKLRVYDQLEVEIIFENADIQGTLELKRSKASPYFSSIAGIVINYKDENAGEGLITSSPVTYVIISDPMFQLVLQPFIQWKKKKGFKVIEGYTNNPSVGTTTTSIKNYLQGLYNSPPAGYNVPSFVLFVGDVAQIPAWSGSAGSHVTDLRYCEYTGDNLPEVFYGRFSANDLTQLQPQIDKTLEYEQYLMPDPSFLGKAVMVAGADVSYGPLYGNGQINYGTENYFNIAHNITPYIYLQPEPTGGNYSQNIKTNVSNGVGYANYTAHCSESGWYDPSFLISDIAGLNNVSKYCLMVGNCCLSSKFDATCFAEEQLRAANKGSVGYIGGSNSTYWDEDYWWGCGFKSVVLHPTYNADHLGAYDGTFLDHGESTAKWFVTQGQMFVCGDYAVEESNSSRKTYYWEIYHLMGDPSLMVYFSVPSAIAATYQNPLMIGMNNLTVNTESYSYVALSLDGDLLDAKIADATGNVSLNFAALSTVADLDLVITKQNKQPLITTVQVIPASGPYVVYTAHTVSDPTPGGNNNGLIDSGESGFLSLSAKNVGVAIASNVVTTLSSSDAYITITDNTENYGNINPNQTVTQGDGFAFTVVANIPDQHIVPFTLTATNGTDTWISNFNITANAPVLAIGTMTVIDNGPGCNNDGILDPGETATLSFVCSNTGHSALANITATLSISGGTSPYLTLNSSVANITTLAAGGSDAATFSVTADASTPIGTPVDLQLSLTGGAYSALDARLVVIGLIPTYIITNGSVTTCPGYFYDSGGPSGSYLDNENFTETFYPSTSGTMIRFTFSAFETESEYDYLKIYNGTSSAATLIGSYSGTTSPGTVNASNASGALTFVFTSDGSITKSGWVAAISCYNTNQPPVAQFTASSTSPTINTTVTFTDQSANIPTSWNWSFSPNNVMFMNGTSATSQNPQVQFTATGTYTVALTVSNSFGSSTETKTDYINVVSCSYCSTSFSNLTDDYISNATLNTINNNSGSTSYSDFTSISTTLVQGATAAISASVTVNGSWVQHCIAWIDWNHNCSFTDDSEIFDLGQTPGTAGTHVLSATVSVPADAFTGITCMRISERYSQDPTPCDAATFGEAEDYSIIVQSPVKILNITLLLEGLFNGTLMNQAYNVDQYGTPFTNFPGTTADTLSVYLAQASSPHTFIYSAHGVNVSTAGNVSVSVPGSLSGNYYIVVRHRQSVETWSQNSVSFAESFVNFNFASASGQAFGNNLKDLTGNGTLWGLFTGDLNHDGFVELNDVNVSYTAGRTSATGYLIEDIDGDGFVEIDDVNKVYINSRNSVGIILPN